MPPTFRACFLHVAVFIAMVLAMQSPAGAAAVAEAPLAKAGQINLHQWDFQRNGPVFLGGEWAFYWQQFIDPAAPPAGAPHMFAELPDAWAGIVVDGKTLGSNGYASYRLLRDLVLRSDLSFLRRHLHLRNWQGIRYL